MLVRSKGDNRAILDVLLQHGPDPAIIYPPLPRHRRLYRRWAHRGPALVSVKVDQWITRVESFVKHYSTAGQGLRHYHVFFQDDHQVGTMSTEIWADDGVVLVHQLDVDENFQHRGFGVAALAWLTRQSNFFLVPVHVTGEAIGFWERMIVRNPRRISPIDLRGADYRSELERRAAVGCDHHDVNFHDKCVWPLIEW